MVKRLAIFAHYDKDKIIDDYVIFYLKSLKEICEKIIFVSACELNENEKSKISEICDYIICENHNEYDFGSWKRGFLSIGTEISQFDEIILANDSCFGPTYSLEKVFNIMRSEACDFWGITENKFGIKGRQRHIQSYFIILKKQVFIDVDFQKFITSVSAQSKKNDIITNYEIGLSKLLFKKGFKGKSYVKKYRRYGNSTIYKWRELLTENLSPFVKCSVLRLQNIDKTTVQDWQKAFINTNYNLSLIENNLKRQNVREIRKNSPLFLKKIFFNFVLFLPKFLRTSFVKVSEKILPLLFD